VRQWEAGRVTMQRGADPLPLSAATSLQACDSTCHHCASNFWAWWKARNFSQSMTYGRSGGSTSFAAAAATSIRAE
jgi:hypothetical protein